jgi:hypothetical protein
MKSRLLASLSITAALASCTYGGCPRTAVEAGRVQWSRQGRPEAFRCEATASKIDGRKFEVACGDVKTQVVCWSASLTSCCTALSGPSAWDRVSGENPTVCEDLRY